MFCVTDSTILPELDGLPYIYVISVQEFPKRINARSLKSNEIKLEWIPYTTTHSAIYASVAILALAYNCICLVHNFGRPPVLKNGFIDEVFGEEALLCSVVTQWMMVFSIFAAGIAVERCVPQPLHIFLSLLATNANTVLFVLNVRKVRDGVISANCEYFVFVTLLFLLSIALCCAYFVAASYYRKQKRLESSIALSRTTSQIRQRCLQRKQNEFWDVVDEFTTQSYSTLE